MTDIDTTQDLDTRVKELEGEMGAIVDALKETSTKFDNLDRLRVDIAKNFAPLYVHSGLGDRVILGALGEDETVKETKRLMEEMDQRRHQE